MRDAFIKVRVSTAAKSTFAKAAADSGESLSDYIRKSANMRRRGETTTAVAELAALRKEINRLGSTANQWAEAMHNGRPVDGKAVLEAYEDMRRLVSDALRDARQ